MEISYGMAAEQAIIRQNITLQVIKQSFDQQKAVANILEQAVQTIAANNNRGNNVNIKA